MVKLKVMRNMLKQSLAVCVGMVVVVFGFAGTAMEIGVPSNPGRPLVVDPQSDGGTVRFLAPLEDGGSPVTDYLIEYREKWSLRWKCVGVSKELDYPFKMRNRAVVQFRVRAVNAVGMGKASKESDFLTIRGAFE